MGIEDVMIDLAKATPVIAVLLYFVIHFKKEAKDKEEHIKMLNVEMRQMLKDNIIALNSITKAIENQNKIIEHYAKK